MALLDNLLGRNRLQHGQYRYGRKAQAIVAKLECLECHERKTLMTTVSEPELEFYLDFSRKQFALRLGPCKTKDGKHDWKTNVLHKRSLAGHCLCEQCWPSPDGQAR